MRNESPVSSYVMHQQVTFLRAWDTAGQPRHHRQQIVFVVDWLVCLHRTCTFMCGWASFWTARPSTSSALIDRLGQTSVSPVMSSLTVMQTLVLRGGDGLLDCAVSVRVDIAVLIMPLQHAFRRKWLLKAIFHLASFWRGLPNWVEQMWSLLQCNQTEHRQTKGPMFSVEAR